jgi:hypothetical protein
MGGEVGGLGMGLGGAFMGGLGEGLGLEMPSFGGGGASAAARSGQLRRRL